MLAIVAIGFFIGGGVFGIMLMAVMGIDRRR